METLKKLIIEKKYRSIVIEEKLVGELFCSSGKIAFSGPFECFAENPAILNLEVPRDRALKIFQGYQKMKKLNREKVLYARIELSDDVITEFAPGSTVENAVLPWKGWDAWDSQLPGETYIGFCDNDILVQIDSYVKKTLKSNYRKIAEILEQQKFAEAGQFVMLKIGDHSFCGGYSSEAQFTLFLGLNSSKKPCSIIIDTGEAKSRVF